MDLLDYESDSSENSTPELQPQVAVPSFIAYLENYTMNRKGYATAFPFLSCELSHASRSKIRSSLSQAVKVIDKFNPGINKLYSSDNVLDQISYGTSLLGTNNTDVAKRPHITMFPTCEARKHQILQFNDNVARRLHLWSPPENLIDRHSSILDSMLGEEGRGNRIKLPLEPEFSVLTLKSVNMLFLSCKIKRTPETESFLKGLSSLLREQADSLNLKYDWWKHVGVEGIDECLYHVSFQIYSLKRPGTAIKFPKVIALEKALQKEIRPMEDLSVNIEDLVILNSNGSIKRFPLL